MLRNAPRQLLLTNYTKYICYFTITITWPNSYLIIKNYFLRSNVDAKRNNVDTKRNNINAKRNNHKREAAEQVQEKAKKKTYKITLPKFLNACYNYLYLGLTEDFPAQQAVIWDDFMKSDFVLERHFTLVYTLKNFKLDLYLFQRYAVKDPVNQQQQSPRLQAKANKVKSFNLTDLTELAAATRVETARSSRPQNRIPAFIIEYKALYKLPLGYIYEGLDNIELEDMIRFRRLMATIRLEYGYMCTGEAFVFLQVPDNPRTVHYFLSVPKNSDGVNRLHLTAEVVYNNLLDTIPLEDASSSEYRPPRHGEFLRINRKPDPDTLSRHGQYCTQKCLLGLVKGGPLDTSCPNIRDYRPVGVPGACGVLFRVRLKSHGYTVAAKSTPIDFVHRLKWEATIYEHLRPIQGIYTPYFYDGIAELVHMMFLSFGGKPIHDLGVLHKDLMPRNMLWNEETGQVMVIDFERAEVVKPRTVLGVISANRKRKRGLMLRYSRLQHWLPLQPHR
ncbi:hypothetical protein K469DRAFT_730386 [Zopfia rhizophila CBS 207.26]|uniref:Aminoglycoside phosphotransferase domain-containing protein n=1 Tax=Zopfia rhizophila CBS 207.26 TaxID=1314779 RepID=A0A6A6DLA9_9PEZI|nr:hypothetical protein K469DRAFT_730386 [Zopfia rhizophila CBS 207.26]